MTGPIPRNDFQTRLLSKVFDSLPDYFADNVDKRRFGTNGDKGWSPGALFSRWFHSRFIAKRSLNAQKKSLRGGSCR